MVTNSWVSLIPYRISTARNEVGHDKFQDTEKTKTMWEVGAQALGIWVERNGLFEIWVLDCETEQYDGRSVKAI